MFIKTFSRIIFFIVSLFLSFQVIAEDRALIIGINAYTANAKGEGPLEGCKTDAENMYRLIQAVWGYKPSQIKMLIDTQATRRAILSAFDDWLIKGSQQGDQVLFYFSGHGSFVKDNNGDEEDGKDEVLCPVNSIPNSDNVIRDDEINARLRKLAGRQVLVITDSCHSGTVTRGFSPATPKRYIYPDQPLFKPATRSIGRLEPIHSFVEQFDHVVHYSAVSPTQMALDSGVQGGVFTNAFISAFRGKAADSNRDGIITHAELLNHVTKRSRAFCEGCKSLLTPQLDANPKWRFVDVTKRTIDPPAPTESPVDTNTMAESLSGNNNTAYLQAQMIPSTTFHLGEKMQMKISSQRQGFLFVLDIDSAGRLTVLFPNEYSKKRNQQGILREGQTITIPDASYGFSFEAQEPVGQGLLLALLIEENEEFVQDFYHKLQSATKGFGVVDGFGVVRRTSQVQETLQRLHQQLHQTLLGHEGVGRPIRWSMVEMDYRIKK